MRVEMSFDGSRSGRCGAVDSVFNSNGARLIREMILAVAPMPRRLEALSTVTAAHPQPMASFAARGEHALVLKIDKDAAAQQRTPLAEGVQL